MLYDRLLYQLYQPGSSVGGVARLAPGSGGLDDDPGALWTLLQTLGEAEEADTVARTSLEWLLAADASMLTAEVRRIREQLEQWRGRSETQR